MQRALVEPFVLIAQLALTHYLLPSKCQVAIHVHLDSIQRHLELLYARRVVTIQVKRKKLHF